jgi:hypothetical protein
LYPQGGRRARRHAECLAHNCFPEGGQPDVEDLSVPLERLEHVVQRLADDDFGGAEDGGD